MQLGQHLGQHLGGHLGTIAGDALPTVPALPKRIRVRALGEELYVTASGPPGVRAGAADIVVTVVEVTHG
jgi:hypothetical protein